MGLPGLLLNALVTAAVGGGLITWWLVSRKRLAEDTVGRASAEAARIRREAERDAENLRKEATLAAREKAHELATEADRQMRVIARIVQPTEAIQAIEADTPASREPSAEQKL